MPWLIPVRDMPVNTQLPNIIKVGTFNIPAMVLLLRLYCGKEHMLNFRLCTVILLDIAKLLSSFLHFALILRVPKLEVYSPWSWTFTFIHSLANY